MNVNIEEQINLEFIKQIEELPEEYKDPVENTLGYIKKRAVCNDYEAAQINILMSEQSAQKQGYNYYCRYIAGLSTPDEDRADYYISIRKSWDKFLDSFAVMSLEERAEALTVVSASFENIEKVLNTDNPEKLDFIFDRTGKYLDKAKSLASELSSKSTGYLITHLEYTKSKAGEIEKTMEDYNKALLIADKEYDIQNPYWNEKDFYGADDEVGIHEDTDYDSDAYNNVVGVLNEFRRIGKNPRIMNGYTVIGKDKKEKLTVGDIIQYRIDSTDDNFPIYKYFIVDKIDTNRILDENNELVDIETWKIRPLDLFSTDSGGKELDLSNTNNSEGMVSIKVKDTGFNYTDEVDDPTKDIHYVLCFGDPEESRLSNLYSVYDTDPTGLKARLREVKPRPSKYMIDSLIAGVVITAVVTIIGGAISIVTGILMCCTVVKAPIGVPLIFTGVGLLIGGITGLISSAITLTEAEEDRKTYENQKKNIFQDIDKHNKFPFESMAFGREGWITLKAKQYINTTDKAKDYYMCTCESGALIIPETTEEIIYDGRGSRYGNNIGLINNRKTTEKEKIILNMVLPYIKKLKKEDKDKPFIHWKPENLDKHPIEVGYGFNGAMKLVGLGKGGNKDGNQEDMFLKFKRIEELDTIPLDNMAITFENRDDAKEKRTELTIRTKEEGKEDWEIIK